MDNASPKATEDHGLEVSPLGRLLVLLGATGFAIGQPVLAMSAENSALFLANDVGGPTVVLIGLAICVLPPLLLWLILSGVDLIRPSVGMFAFLGVLAALYGLAIQQLLRWGLGLDNVVAVSLGEFKW